MLRYGVFTLNMYVKTYSVKPFRVEPFYGGCTPRRGTAGRLAPSSHLPPGKASEARDFLLLFYYFQGYSYSAHNTLVGCTLMSLYEYHTVEGSSALFLRLARINFDKLLFSKDLEKWTQFVAS